MKAQADVLVKSVELQKGVTEEVQKIGDTAIPSSSKLRKSMSGRFAQEKEDKNTLSRPQVLRKSFELLKEGKITTLQGIKIESAMNKNLPLPEDVADLFEAKGA